MNETIIYRPYRTHSWFLPFTLLIAALVFVAAGYCLAFCGFSVLVLGAIGIACIWLTKVLYDSSNLAVSFDYKGLQIIGGSYIHYRQLLWEELSYAYYVRSFRGHLFLVMSSRALSPSEARKLANRGANSSRICIRYAVVIHIDVLQDVSQLKELIDNHILHVEVY